MFQCRLCQENPFNIIFGGGEQDQQSQRSEPREERRRKPRRQRAPGSRRDEAAFSPRQGEELREAVATWEDYAHPRANDFFSSREKLVEVLEQLASGIDKHDDPILGPEDRCVFWYGDVTKDDLQAALKMVKPGQTEESVTYVNRVLAFIFAKDSTFEQLMALPKVPFKMSCGDQLCIHLAHVSLEAEDQ